MTDKYIRLGTDDYRKLRENNGYYVDKTLFVEEFFNNPAEVTLITRPRRFGKTINLTMLREFLDITKDSRDIFQGTKIMDTDYARKINTVPVVYMSFKNCSGIDKEKMIVSFKGILLEQYDFWYNVIINGTNSILETTKKRFLDIYHLLQDFSDDVNRLEAYIPNTIFILSKLIAEHYNIKPIVIIDEYDNPFIEARNNGYYKEINTMLSAFFVTSFKGNEYMDRALLTGIQRIAQESIFSKFNNPSICTVVDYEYADKFGLIEDETRLYLENFGYTLSEEIKAYYNGYRFGEQDMYNPMSIASYIQKRGKLTSYWVNTSSNSLIREEIPKASKDFFETFKQLIEKGNAVVKIDFATTFAEKQDTENLWGLLLNAGYITVSECIADSIYTIRIPNAEVRSEFKNIVSNYINVPELNLFHMFNALLTKDVNKFMKIYEKIILDITSCFDSIQKENSYHMLMLGMCAYLQPRFEVKSNLENGTGRADIIIKALQEGDMNVVIEFKYEPNANADSQRLKLLADEGLKQIHDNKYYNGLKGDVLLLGIAHHIKNVEMVYDVVCLA